MVGERLLVHRANKLAKIKRNNTCALTYDDAQKTGVIFTIDDLTKHQAIKDFVSRLKSDGKEVEVMSFLPRKKENHEFIFNYFTDKDVSLLGRFNNEEVVNFTTKPFDYIFCLDCRPHPLIESILAMSKASCRIGCYQEGKNQFYEMMIQPREYSTDSLIRETWKYIKIIK